MNSLSIHVTFTAIVPGGRLAIQLTHVQLAIAILLVSLGDSK